eukprot:4619734-Amphidinium_carterae.1
MPYRFFCFPLGKRLLSKHFACWRGSSLLVCRGKVSQFTFNQFRGLPPSHVIGTGHVYLSAEAAGAGQRRHRDSLRAGEPCPRTLGCSVPTKTQDRTTCTEKTFDRTPPPLAQNKFHDL